MVCPNQQTLNMTSIQYQTDRQTDDSQMGTSIPAHGSPTDLTVPVSTYGRTDAFMKVNGWMEKRRVKANSSGPPVRHMKVTSNLVTSTDSVHSLAPMVIATVAVTP